MITLTKDQLKVFRPCGDQIKLFGKLNEMNAQQAFDAGASIRDLCWVAQKLGRKDLLVRFALKCAQSVVHLSTDPCVQAALDATQTWIDNPSEKNRLAAFAAFAADAAGYGAVYAAAAAAAAAAVYAAAAASAAADAVYAAAAASAAADAAGYAAAASAARKQEIEKQKQWFVEIFS